MSEVQADVSGVMRRCVEVVRENPERAVYSLMLALDGFPLTSACNDVAQFYSPLPEGAKRQLASELREVIQREEARAAAKEIYDKAYAHLAYLSTTQLQVLQTRATNILKRRTADGQEEEQAYFEDGT